MTLPYFLAPAVDSDAPGVVVVMEAWGITPQLLRVCQRLAAGGYTAVAPDIYWRFGGSDPAAWERNVANLRHRDALADIDAAIAVLRERGARKVGITGFCMGGAYTYAAAVHSDVDAAVSFYGGGIASFLREPRCPILMFFGDQDAFIPMSEVEAIERHHRSGSVVVYEGADHGFFRDGHEAYHEAAAQDAWGRLLALFSEHLLGGSGRAGPR